MAVCVTVGYMQTTKTTDAVVADARQQRATETRHFERSPLSFLFSGVYESVSPHVQKSSNLSCQIDIAR